MTLTLDEYQQFVLSVAAPGSDLVCAALGVAGEASELVGDVLDIAPQENILKECGDVAWYCALGAHSLNYRLSFICRTNDPQEFYDINAKAGHSPRSTFWAQHIIRLSGMFSDSVKKVRYHGHSYVDEKPWQYFRSILGSVVYIGMAYGITFPEIIDANVSKLRQRYGTQFSAAASVNRTT